MGPEDKRSQAAPVADATGASAAPMSDERSVVISEIRRVRRHPTSLVDADVAVAVAAQSDLAAQLDDCLGRLPEPRRLAVALHLQGFTSAEAARALGWNEKRVRNLVFRGIEDLRRCLSGRTGKVRR